MLLTLPAEHPLAAAADITPGDLDGQHWIAVKQTQNPHWRDAFVSSCVANGFTPDIRTEAADPLTALGLVASGLGLALVQRSMADARAGGVAVREIPWFDEPLSLWAVWHRIDLRPIVAVFRETVLSAAASATTT